MLSREWKNQWKDGWMEAIHISVLDLFLFYFADWKWKRCQWDVEEEERAHPKRESTWPGVTSAGRQSSHCFIECALRMHREAVINIVFTHSAWTEAHRWPWQMLWPSQFKDSRRVQSVSICLYLFQVINYGKANKMSWIMQNLNLTYLDIQLTFNSIRITDCLSYIWSRRKIPAASVYSSSSFYTKCVYIRIYDRMLDSVFLFWRMYTVKHFINKSYQGRPIDNEQKC